MEKFDRIYDAVKKVVVLAVIISLTVTVIDLSYKNYSKDLKQKGIYFTIYKIEKRSSSQKGNTCKITERIYKYKRNMGWKWDGKSWKEENQLLAENEIGTDIDCNLAVGLLSKENLKIIP